MRAFNWVMCAFWALDAVAWLGVGLVSHWQAPHAGLIATQSALLAGYAAIVAVRR